LSGFNILIKNLNLKETYNYLTIEELNIFLHTAKKYEDITGYTFLLVAVYTGMRKGEICGLHWKNIDFKNNIITIERVMILVRVPRKLKIVIEEFWWMILSLIN